MGPNGLEILYLVIEPRFKDILSQMEVNTREKTIKIVFCKGGTLVDKIIVENNRLLWNKLINSLKIQLKWYGWGNKDHEEAVEASLNKNSEKIHEALSQPESNNTADKKIFKTYKYSGSMLGNGGGILYSLSC